MHWLTVSSHSPFARFADDLLVQLQFGCLAVVQILERHLQRVDRVLAALRPSRPSAATPAEHEAAKATAAATEQIGERMGVGAVIGAVTLLQAVNAHLIVDLSLALVRQNFVGVGDFFELQMSEVVIKTLRRTFSESSADGFLSGWYFLAMAL